MARLGWYGGVNQQPSLLKLMLKKIGEEVSDHEINDTEKDARCGDDDEKASVSQARAAVPRRVKTMLKFLYGCHIQELLSRVQGLHEIVYELNASRERHLLRGTVKVWLNGLHCVETS